MIRKESLKYIRVSPSGKASDSDSDSTWVRILPPEPKKECASKDVHSFFELKLEDSKRRLPSPGFAKQTLDEG